MFDSLVGPITNLVGALVDRIWPDPAQAADAKFKLLQLAQDGTIKQLMAETDLAKAQDAINEAEAQNKSIFVAGWRPWIGWACGAGFTVQFVMIPIFGYGYALYTGHPAPAPLVLPDILWEVILGILGLNIGARTYEKVNGINSGK